MENNKKSHRQSRVKRSNRETKKAYCTGLEITSILADSAANKANVLTSAAGSFNLMGIPVGAAVAAPSASVAMAAYGKKLAVNLAYVASDCGSIPFDELKEDLNRNYEAIQSGFASVKKLLENLPIRQSNIETVTSRLITFIESFITKQSVIKRLTKDQLIAKLEEQNGILFQLERDTVSTATNSLHTLLSDMLNRKFAIPKNVQDEIAFTALGLLSSGIDTYIEVMNFLLQGQNYLASHYHQQSDVEAYNRHFNLYSNILRSFTTTLNGIDNHNGLIDKVGEVFKNVSDLDFVKSERKIILEFASNNTAHLKKIKSELISISGLSRDKPTQQIQYDFSNSTIVTPIAKWQSGRKVSYAMQYKAKDKSIYYQIADWSTPYTLSTKANPLLNIGSGSENMTRLVFRKFDNQTPVLVAIIENAQQHSFRDIDRDLYDAALEPNREIAKERMEFFIKNGADIRAKFENGKQAIHAAAQSGRIGNVLMLVEKGVDIGARDFNGYAPVHIAAESGNENFIRELMRHGADINAKTNLDWTPLHIAAGKGFVNVVETLLQDKAVAINSPAENGFTALHTAVASDKIDVINLLVKDNRTNVNAVSEAGLTPLHLASVAGNFATIKRLVENGANVNLKSKDGYSPLILAASSGRLEIVTFLVEKGAILATKNEAGVAAIDTAALKGHSTIVEFFINRFNNDKKIRSLEEGMFYGNLETTQLAIVKYLIKEKKFNLDVNSKNDAGNVALFSAVRSGYLKLVKYFIEDKIVALNIKDSKDHIPLHVAAQYGHLEIVKYFIEDKNVDFNIRDKSHYAPVHLAVQSGHLEVVKYFIEDKKVPAYSRGDFLLLHLAAQSGHLEVVKYLVEDKHVDVSIRDGRGYFPLHVAAQFGHLEVVKYFIEDKNIDVNLRIQHEYGSGVVPILNEKTGVTQFKYYTDKTSLHLAAESGQLAVIKYLIEDRKANVNIRDSSGAAPVHVAVQYGQLAVVKYLIEDRKVDVNIKDSVVRGNTPLHLAAEFDRLEVIKYLVEDAKADVNAKNGNEDTPLHVAAQFDRVQVIKYLVEDAKADVNATNYSGRTPYSVALWYLGAEGAATQYLLSNNNAPPRSRRSIESKPLPKSVYTAQSTFLSQKTQSIATDSIPSITGASDNSQVEHKDSTADLSPLVVGMGIFASLGLAKYVGVKLKASPIDIPSPERYKEERIRNIKLSSDEAMEVKFKAMRVR